MSKMLRLYILATAVFFSSFTFFQSQEIQDDAYEDDSTAADNSVPVTFGIENLQRRIDAILANPGLRRTDYGVSVFSVDKNTFYYQKNGDKLLTPASTTKLFSTYTAFYTLDTADIQTSVYADGEIKNGVLNGNLYIVSRGDAFFNIRDLEMLADRVNRSGIKKVNGSVFADKSFFDEDSDRFHYSGDRDAVVPIPPIEAFSLNQNKITVLVSSSSIPGAPLHVQTVPISDAFTVEGKVFSSGPAVSLTNDGAQPTTPVIAVPQKKAAAKTVPKKKAVKPAPKKPTRKKSTKRRRSDLFEPENDHLNRYGDMYYAQRGRRRSPRRRAAPPKPSLVVTSEVLPSGIQNFKVSGTLPPSTTKTYTFTIKNPELAVAGTLRSRLIASGIEITGKEIGVAVRPEKAYEIAEFRRPLVNTIEIVNKQSHNWLAEHMFRMIGGQNNNGKMSTAKSAKKAIFKALSDAQIPCKGCVINDGSGLSRRNLLTTDAEALLLASAARQPWADKYMGSLSIAGEDGTLRKRMRDTPAEKNIKGKTGTLRNVSALAGYVRTADGELLSFAIISNGPSVGLYKQIENQIGSTLAGFSGKQ